MMSGPFGLIELTFLRRPDGRRDWLGRKWQRSDHDFIGLDGRAGDEALEYLMMRARNLASYFEVDSFECRILWRKTGFHPGKVIYHNKDFRP